MDTHYGRDDLAAWKQGLKEAGVEYLFGAYVDTSACRNRNACQSTISKWWRLRTLYSRRFGGDGALGPHEDECVGLPDLASLTSFLGTAVCNRVRRPVWHGSHTVISRAVLRRQKLQQRGWVSG